MPKPKKKTVSKEVKSDTREPKKEFKFEATGKTKDKFDEGKKVLEATKETSLIILRSEWLSRLLDKGKKIFPILKKIKLKKLEESVVSFFTICIRLFSVIAATFLIVASLRGILNESYSLEPFKVPESFVQDGLDGQEASSHLLQEVQKIFVIVQEEPKIKYDFNKDLVKEDVIIMGISLNSIKQIIRSSMGIQNKVIAGGIIKRIGELEISLRISTVKEPFAPIQTKIKDGDLYKAFDELMEKSAIQLVEKTEPKAACSYYLNTESYTSAKSIAKVLISYESSDEKSFGHFCLGYVYYIEKEQGKAIEQFQKAIEVNPNFPMAYYNLGVVLNESGDKKRANEEYAKVIRVMPYYTLANYNSCISLKELGDYKGAIERCKKAIEMEPDFSFPYILWGEILNEMGDNKGGIEKIKKAIEIDPNEEKAYIRWGNILNQLGDNKGAIEKYKKVIEINPNEEKTYFNWGEILKQLGDNKGAIEKYKKVIEINPNQEKAYLNWGNILRQSGDDKGAIEKYQKAIDINPNEEKTYLILGITLLDLKDTKSAIEKYKKAIEINPNYTDAYLQWGDILKQLGDTKGAIEKYKKVIEIEPDHLSVYLVLYDLIKNLDNKKSIIEKLKKIIEVNPPKNAETYLSWGNALLNLINDYKGASDAYKKAIEINPNYFEAYDNLGWSLYELGDYSNAILNFKKALEINPDHANAYLNWGNALEGLGDKKTAFEKYRITIQKYESQLIKEPAFYFHYMSIAEADAFLKEKENFYKNFEIALKNEIKLTKKRITEKPYTYYSQEERFQGLVKKYSGIEK